MEFLLDVYLVESPSLADIQSLAKDKKMNVILDGSEIHFEDKHGDRLFYYNWPTLKIESEDLPEDVQDFDEKFSVLINVIGKGDKGERAAIGLAKDLLRRFKGVVYAPQIAEIVFPKKIPVKSAKTKKEKITVLTLIWFFLDKFDGEKINGTLLLLQEHASFCLPQRFGGAPPFQGSVERDGWNGFVATCEKEQSGGSLGWVFWTATRPCLEGLISLPTPSKRSRLLSNEEPVSTIKLELDYKMLEEQGESQLVRSLLVTLATELNAIYAAVLVNHDVSYKPGDLGGTTWNFGSTAYWGGIPDVRTWITWFGTELKERVAKYIPDELVEQNGHLLQLGDTPRTPDELIDVFPKIPDHLINLDGSFSPSFRFGNRDGKARYRPRNSAR